MEEEGGVIYQNEMIIDNQQLDEVLPEMMSKLLFRNIVLLYMQSAKPIYYPKYQKQSEYFWGTGLLISKNLILTCAHNCYDDRPQKDQRQRMKKIICYRSNDGFKKDYEISDRYVPDEYYLDGWHTKDDYALLKLRNQVEQDQFLSLYGHDGYLIPNNSYMFIFGGARSNPNDQKPLYNYNNLDRKIFGRLQKVEGQKINIHGHDILGYRISTLGGMSGCPIIVADDASGLNSRVVGIHAAGGKNSITGKEENRGVYLKQQVIQQLQFKASQLGADPFREYKKDKANVVSFEGSQIIQVIEASEYNSLGDAQNQLAVLVKEKESLEQKKEKKPKKGGKSRQKSGKKKFPQSLDKSQNKSKQKKKPKKEGKSKEKPKGKKIEEIQPKK